MVEVDILGMRYLGVDYGTKQMGIAVSDEGGSIAFPKSVVRAGGDRARTREILRIAKSEGVGMVVLGIPCGPAGAKSKTVYRISAFLTRLRKESPVPVALENEMFSTRLASASTSPKAKIDAAAAAIILQSYLDRKSEARNSKSEINSNDQNSKFKTRVQNF